MTLRDYQQAAVDAAIAHMKKSLMPGLLELATGAGKSHIVAAIAQWVHQSADKRVLCLQPSKELTEQNFEKYIATGNRASIFSASAGSKCMRWPVVYGTPGTVKNSLSRFGDQFGAVILDESHGLTPTIRMIIDSIREKNPRLRVIGLTATPYTMMGGYIYQYDIDGSFVPEDQARDPYFNNLLYRITTRELIDMGFLTPAHADPEHAASYEAGGLELNRRGQYEAADIERVFEGRGRLTADIVADIVHHSRERRGVMIFAATVQHAKEIMESLPPELSRMIGGDVNMRRAERKEMIDDFKAQRFKYIVSVGTLTTGFDAPHVDVVAIMRATESPGLLQQIIGRGLRLYPDKNDVLVLDYAQNIERFNLHDDLFTPEIRVRGSDVEGTPAQIECPSCGFDNEFSLRPEYLEMKFDKYGYLIDLDGNPIQTEHGPMPAHYGRRCTGQVRDPDAPGIYVRCEQRWTHKECPECEADNDIAARYCRSCRAEMVDPNERLQREFIRVRKDPHAIKTDRVALWSAHPHTSQSGKECVRCEYRVEYPGGGRDITIYYVPDSRHPAAIRSWESLSRAVYHGHIAPNAGMFLDHLDRGTQPLTLTYKKDKGGKFFEAIDHNRPADTIGEVA